MAYKQARNRAFSTAPRLYRATYHDEIWTTDTWAAIAGDRLEDYKLRQDQHIADGQPIMDSILDGVTDIAATIETRSDLDGIDVTKLSADESSPIYTVQTKYINLIKAYYPEARPFVRKDGYRFAPVMYRMPTGTLVGCIMPLKA